MFTAAPYFQRRTDVRTSAVLHSGEHGEHSGEQDPSTDRSCAARQGAAEREGVGKHCF